MIRYTTIERPARAEQTIERSRFLAYLEPVESRAEAEAFLARIRREDRDATHNVPAFVIGEKMQLQWASDDGEPQGTSGAPMLQMLVREGLTNVCVVVSRWFGGIKLGTGGLVRAYTGTLRLALDAAGRRDVRDVVLLSFALDYSLLARFQNMEKDLPFAIEKLEYLERIGAEISCEPEAENQIRKALSELTQGRFEVAARSETLR